MGVHERLTSAYRKLEWKVNELRLDPARLRRAKTTAAAIAAAFTLGAAYWLVTRPEETTRDLSVPAVGQFGVPAPGNLARSATVTYKRGVPLVGADELVIRYHEPPIEEIVLHDDDRGGTIGDDAGDYVSVTRMSGEKARYARDAVETFTGFEASRPGRIASLLGAQTGAVERRVLAQGRRALDVFDTLYRDVLARFAAEIEEELLPEEIPASPLTDSVPAAPEK